MMMTFKVRNAKWVKPVVMEKKKWVKAVEMNCGSPRGLQR